MVLSIRGGDFELVVGEDFSIGYLSHDAATVTMFIEESMTFRLLSPQAADRLTGFAIDKYMRALEKPSDHVPIRIDLA